jgi:hypothetical protein
VTENEHGMQRGALENVTKNPKTGVSDYGDRQYDTDDTFRWERKSALAKTPGDNAATEAIKDKIENRQGVNYREEVFNDARNRMTQAARAANSVATEEEINTYFLKQEGKLFGLLKPGDVLERLPDQSRGQRALESLKNFGRAITYTATGSNRFLEIGTGLARGLIPGFVEAEAAAVTAPYATGLLASAASSVGLSVPASAYGVAEAIAAAPTTFAAAVTLPAIGGAIVGNVVEKELGVGAAVASAAITGAVIGSFIPIPGLSTLAGAAVGAVIGLAGYGISKLF